MKLSEKKQVKAKNNQDYEEFSESESDYKSPPPNPLIREGDSRLQDTITEKDEYEDNEEN